jgi:predicted AAA+ superfamily ATPase
VDILAGGYPEVIARPAARALWFSSHIQTYLERDVRAITQIRDLGTFRRFMGLLASRHGQVLGKTDLAAPLGVSIPTITQWLSILETTGLLALIPPYFENFGKRLIKSPKLYWLDSGLVCHLLGIQTRAELERSPFLGALWEGHVAAEILKTQINKGAREELYYFRDERGLEVDFLVPATGGRVRLIEAKATRTPAPHMVASMLSLAASIKHKIAGACLVYRPAKTSAPTKALSPGVSAMDIFELIEAL